MTFLTFYGVDESKFGFIFAIVASGIISASQLNRVFLRKYTSLQILKVTLPTQLILGILLSVLSKLNWLSMEVNIALLFLISALLFKKFSVKQSGDEFVLGIIGVSSLIISTLVLSKPSVVIFFGGQLLLTITLAVAIRYANSWRLYLPWFAILAVGPYMWLQVVI